MKQKTQWGIAIKALKKNKLQTILTMIGMTIGVATVLTMIALGSGAEQSIQDQVRSAGMNMLIVTGGNWSRGNDSGNGGNMAAAYEPMLGRPRLVSATYDPRQGAHLMRGQQFGFQQATWDASDSAHLMRVQGEGDTSGGGSMVHGIGRPGDGVQGHGASTTLVDADVQAMRKLKGVQYVSGGVHDTVKIPFGGATVLTSMHGDDTSLPKIRRGWTFPFGKFYSASDEKSGANVVVLGQFVATKMFGAASPVGKMIELKGEQFKVVGVVGSGSWMVTPAQGDDQFDAVYVPVKTMQRMMHQDYLTVAAVTTESTGDVLRVQKALKDLLEERHHIGRNDPDDFTVKGEAHQTMAHGMRPDVANAVMGNAAGLEKITLDQLGKTLDQASATMSALLTSIAAVSLLVGGIGVMNIMLLSVSQRTKEIGIRRALGARSADVLTQFLLEATTLSVVGGLAGIVIGCIVAASIAKTVQWSTNISIPAVTISFGVSAAIGIFFGYYPARQASQILPIKALKHE